MMTALALNMPFAMATCANTSSPDVMASGVIALSPANADAYVPPSEFAGSDLTEAVYQGSVIENAIDQLLGHELSRKSVNADALFAMAERMTATIRDHLPTLAAALTPYQRRSIHKIATDSSIDEQNAMVEYLANASLIRALRDYHDLPARNFFLRNDRAGGFIALTKNGSIISSGPPVLPRRNRTFHYIRMPSRKIPLSNAETRRGQLKRDIRIGHRLRSTAYSSSRVTMLLYVTPDKASEFEHFREWTVTGVSAIHLTVNPEKDS